MKTEKEIKKEKGVWIVYDLDANRLIQELLTRQSFEFRFDPSLKIERQKALKDVLKMIDELDKKYEEGQSWILDKLKSKIKKELGEEK